MEDVDRQMRDLVATLVPGRGGRMVTEQLASGGKRLRARVALAAAEALRVPRRAAIAWAAAVELLHNATLVHDDVQDGDRLRRGRPTLWARHGEPQAINAGDAMLMLPFLALRSMAPAERGVLSSLLASYSIDAVMGQIAEMDLLADELLDWDSYLRAAAGKTGALFALPVAGAVLLAGANEAEARDVAGPFGRLGVAFQIVDDIRDLYGDKGRKAGSDLCEGKVSALVVAHLERCPQDRRWLLDVLRAPRDATKDLDVSRAMTAFRDSGALSAAVERAQALLDEVDASPVFVHRPALREVVHLLSRACVAPAELALRGVA